MTHRPTVGRVERSTMDLSEVYEVVAAKSEDRWVLQNGESFMQVAHNGTLVASCLPITGQIMIHDHDSVSEARLCAETAVFAALLEGTDLIIGREVDYTPEIAARLIK